MPDTSEPIPAIGYVRVSMMREDGVSPEIQKAAVSEWAARRSRVIVDWVEDLDLTGREFAKRKIAAMIERVSRGEAREIAVWKYSRFGQARGGGEPGRAGEGRRPAPVRHRGG